MNIRELTCIVCPRGCALVAELDESGTPVRVSGNMCPRGKEYAMTECTDPRRVVTTTVRCADGGVVSCKTDRSIPKALVLEAMRVINSTVAANELNIGDVIIEDILGTGACVVATGRKSI